MQDGLESTSMSKVLLNGAPLHMERVAKVLLSQRRDGDCSTCDLRIEVKGGFDLVHSAVVGAHSSTFATVFEHTRPPYAPYDMSGFNGRSVRRVVDWMYSGEMRLTEKSIRDDLAVASHLRVAFLKRQIEHHLKKMAESGQVIFALNVASAEDVAVTSETMLHLVLVLHSSLSSITTNELAKLSPLAVICVAASMLPTDKKLTLVNALITWTRVHQPEHNLLSTIVNSITLRDVKFDDLSAFRHSLLQYLSDPAVAPRIVVGRERDGKLAIHLEKRSQIDSRFKSSAELFANPTHVSESENDFSSSASSKNVSLAPHNSLTGDDVTRHFDRQGLPVKFTRSEVTLINSLPDPFESRLVPTTPEKRPAPVLFIDLPAGGEELGWKNYTSGRGVKNKEIFTETELEDLRRIPDCFGRSPLVTDPSVSRRRSRTDMPVDYRPDYSPSTASTASVVSEQPGGLRRQGRLLKMTDSELFEIHKIPSFTSNKEKSAKDGKEKTPSKTDVRKTSDGAHSIYLYNR